MIQANTVIVLGAGASFDYGLPLGSQLTKDAINYLRSHQETVHDEFLRTRTDINGFSKIASVIEKSRTPTLDAFIEKNLKFAGPLKSAIAGVLLAKEDRVISDLSFPERDWIAWLYHNRMESSPEKFIDNKIAFVSFNYDRIPHALLARFMANTHELNIATAIEIVGSAVGIGMPQENFGFQPDDVLVERFMYVHGQLGTELSPRGTTLAFQNKLDQSLPQTVDPNQVVDQKYLKEISSGIETISESDRVQDGNANERMKILFENAEKIIFLGMGYHSPNLAKLGFTKEYFLNNKSKSKFIGGTGMGLSERDREYLYMFFGNNFELGRNDQDCLSYLQEYL